MLLLLLAAQVATPAPATAPPAAPTKFSILQPVATEPCAKRGSVPASEADDVVVCGRPLPSQTLPYPDEVVLDEPRPSNPDRSGIGALAVEDGTPCSAVQSGCTTGIDIFGGGTQVVRFIQKVVAPDSCCERPGEASDLGMLAGDVAHGVGRLFRKKPDTSNRVAIPLDDAPVSTAGKILP